MSQHLLDEPLKEHFANQELCRTLILAEFVDC